MTRMHFTNDGRCPVHNVRAVDPVRSLPRLMSGRCPYCARQLSWVPTAADEIGERAGASPSWTAAHLSVVHVR